MCLQGHKPFYPPCLDSHIQVDWAKSILLNEVIHYLGWIVSFACINHKLTILQGVFDQLLGFSLTNNAAIIAQVSMRNMLGHFRLPIHQGIRWFFIKDAWIQLIRLAKFMFPVTAYGISAAWCLHQHLAYCPYHLMNLVNAGQFRCGFNFHLLVTNEMQIICICTVSVRMSSLVNAFLRLLASHFTF